jgi:hypothetical protein
VREHLQSVARRLGREPPELKAPPLRPSAMRLWSLFCELASARQVGQVGFQPISWAEMKAWAELRGLDLAPWEAKALRRLDGVFLRVSRSWLSTSKAAPAAGERA